MKAFKPYDFSELSPEQILEKLKLNKPPFKVCKIAKQMGIEVSNHIDYEYIKYDIEGRAFAENGKPKIWISSGLSPNRQRFTLAHEIGHVVRDILPRLKNQQEVKEFTDHGGTLSFNSDGARTIKEALANNFAGELLMPEFAIKQGIQDIIKDNQDNPDRKKVTFVVPKLAKKFEVSQQAMNIRLIRLGMIT